MWNILGTPVPKMIRRTRIFQDLFDFCSQQAASAAPLTIDSGITRTVNRLLRLETVFVEDLH
jgi:hypothetical protein